MLFPWPIFVYFQYWSIIIFPNQRSKKYGTRTHCIPSTLKHICWSVYQGKAAPIKIKASLLWGEVTDKDLYFGMHFPKLDVFQWVWLTDIQIPNNQQILNLTHLDSPTWGQLQSGQRWPSSALLWPRKARGVLLIKNSYWSNWLKARECPVRKQKSLGLASWWQGETPDQTERWWSSTAFISECFQTARYDLFTLSKLTIRSFPSGYMCYQRHAKLQWPGCAWCQCPGCNWLQRCAPFH